jgi:hypothetical protein
MVLAMIFVVMGVFTRADGGPNQSARSDARRERKNHSTAGETN